MQLYPKFSRIINVILRWLVLAIVILSPLPLGLNRPELWNLFCVISGVLGCIGLFVLPNNPTLERVSKYLLAPTAVTLISIGFIIVQPNLLFPSSISSLGADISELGLITNIELFGLGFVQVMEPLTLYLSYLIIFWLAVITYKSSSNSWRLIEKLVFAGLLYSIYGLAVYFSGNKSVLWFEKWASLGDLTSVFVNRNTYATFAGIMLLTSISFLISVSGRQRITSIQDLIFISKKDLWRLYLGVLAILGNASALFLTHSRGGFIAGSLSVFALLSMHLLKRRQLTFLSILPLILISAFLLFSFQFSDGITLDRLSKTNLNQVNRLEVYRSVVAGIEASPYIGWGFGAFEEKFRPFYSEGMGVVNWNKAHNTYLEVLFELGLIFGTLFFVPIILLSITIAGMGLRRKRQYHQSILSLAVIILCGVHAFIDFSNQIPAVAILFSWLLGNSVADSVSRIQRTQTVKARETQISD